MAKARVSKDALPHNDEVEKTVIGAAIKYKSICASVVSSLKLDDIYEGNTKNQKIFNAIIRICKRLEPVDYEAVIHELINANDLEEAGGPEYVLECVDSVLSVANIENHIQMLKEQAKVRKLLKVIEEIQGTYLKGDIGTSDEFLKYAEKTFLEVTRDRRIGKLSHASEVANELKNTVNTLQECADKEKVTGVNTGYNQLNFYTHGFQPNNFIILAARPGVGKTAFALNIAYKAAVKNNCSVAFFSLEMSNQEVMTRLVATESAVPQETIKVGYKLGFNERGKIYSACENISKTNLYFEECPGISVLDLMAQARKFKEEKPDLGLIVIDYLNLIAGESSIDARQNQVQYNSQMLKKLAMELKIPILCLAQLNRNMEQRGGRPMMSDLRESGSIEADADIIMLLWQEESSSRPYQRKKGFGSFEKNDEDAKKEDAAKRSATQTLLDAQGTGLTLMVCTIEKNRHGRTGDTYYLFDKSLGEFRNPSEEFLTQYKAIKSANFSGGELNKEKE